MALIFPSAGGAFNPNFDYQPLGNWDLSKIASLSMPSASLTTYPAASIPGAALTANSVTNAQVAANTIGSGQLALSIAQQATGTLSAANIIAMNGAPITLVAAPGAGFAVIFGGAIFEFIGTSTQFTGGGAVQIQYHGQATNLMASTIAATTIQANATAILNFLPVQTASGTVATANLGLDITNATGAFAAGTGTMKYWIDYQVVTL